MKTNYLLISLLFGLLLIFSAPTSKAQNITVPSEIIGKNIVFEISFADAPGSASDWIGLFSFQGDNSSYIAYHWLGSQTHGNLLFQSSLESGTYDFRMFNQNNELICRTEPFVVREALMLNQEFNTSGFYHADFSGDNLDDWAVDIKIAPDNKIVVAGAAHSGDTSTRLTPIVNFIVARFHPDGQPDLSFGTNGKVITAIPGIEAEEVRALVVQSDGKIIVGGSGVNYGIGNCLWQGSFILVRYDIDGNLDNTFGNNGVVLTNFTLPGELTGYSSDELRCLSLQPDGKILAGGRGAQCYSTYRCNLARYTTNGTLDNSFSDDGKLVFAYSAAESQWVEAIAPPLENGDGSIFIATIYKPWIYAPNSNYIYKIDATGNFINSFGDNGLVIDSRPGLDGGQFPQSISIGPDGMVYLVGCTGGAGYIWIMKKDPLTGEPVAGFGDNGLVVSENTSAVIPIGSVFHENMLYVGTHFLTGFWSVVRFNIDGEIDPSYGWPLISVNEQNEEPKAMAMQGDGDFVLAGSGQFPAPSDQDFLVVNLTKNTTHYLNNLALSGSTSECYGSNENIYIRNFEVEAGSSAELIAANKILIFNYTKIESGGYFHASITTNNTYCVMSKTIVEAIDEKLLPQSESLPESKSGLFRFYPNPTQGILHIESANQSVFGPMIVEVLNIMGKRMKSIELHGSSPYQLDLSDVPNGVYVVRVLNDGKADFVKVVKQ